jgi:outer membrane receptor protein involved in Fe transport
LFSLSLLALGQGARAEDPIELGEDVGELSLDSLLDLYATLTDVLRDVPGMDPVEYSFSEYGTLLPIRGVSGNNKVIVLVNNVRVNPPGGEDMPLRRDFSVRNAEQVEILYGPGSTLYGQDAISAVINVITREPGRGGESVGGEALFSYGTRQSLDAYGQVGAVLGQVAGEEVHFTAHAEWQRATLTDYSTQYPEFWAAYEPVIEPIRGAGFSPRRTDDGRNVSAQIASGGTLIQAWYRESSRSSSEGGFAPILHFVDEAVWHDRSLVISASNTSELASWLELASSLAWNRYEVAPDTRYVFAVGEELFLDDYKYALGTGFTVEERLVAQPLEELTLMLGLTGSSFDVIPKATVPGGADLSGDIVSQAGSFSYYTTPGDPESLVVLPRATDLVYQTYATYLEGAWRPLSLLGLVAGVRADLNTRFDEVPVSPRLALLVHPLQGLTAKYIFTQAFVAPAPYYGYNVFDNGVALNQANPDLAPETARSNELALSFQSVHALLGVSAYFTTQQNLLVVGDRATPLNIVDEEVYLDVEGTTTRLLTQTANGGQSRSMGVDVYGRYSAWNFEAWSSVSVVDFRSELQGQTSGLDGLSAVNVRAGLTFKPIDGLALTPSFTLRSTPQNLAQPEAPLLVDESEVPYEVNAYARYSPTDWLEGFVSARNLTNRRGALRGLVTPVPQESLQVSGGVRLSF